MNTASIVPGTLQHVPTNGIVSAGIKSNGLKSSSTPGMMIQSAPFSSPVAGGSPIQKTVQIRFVTNGNNPLLLSQVDSKEKSGYANSFLQFVQNGNSSIVATSVTRSINCNQCSEKFQTETERRQHVVNVHETRRLQCKLCEQEFKNVKEFIEHQSEHSKAKNVFVIDNKDGSSITGKTSGNSKSFASPLVLTTLPVKATSMAGKTPVIATLSRASTSTGLSIGQSQGTPHNASLVLASLNGSPILTTAKQVVGGSLVLKSVASTSSSSVTTANPACIPAPAGSPVGKLSLQVGSQQKPLYKFTELKDKQKKALSLKHQQKKFQCAFCAKQFVRKAQLKVHITNVHGSVLKSMDVGKHSILKSPSTQFRCPKCGRLFKVLKMLSQHIKICAGDVGSSICKKMPSVTASVLTVPIKQESVTHRVKADQSLMSFSKSSDVPVKIEPLAHSTPSRIKLETMVETPDHDLNDPLIGGMSMQRGMITTTSNLLDDIDFVSQQLEKEVQSMTPFNLDDELSGINSLDEAFIKDVDLEECCEQVRPAQVEGSASRMSGAYGHNLCSPKPSASLKIASPTLKGRQLVYSNPQKQELHKLKEFDAIVQNCASETLSGMQYDSFELIDSAGSLTMPERKVSPSSFIVNLDDIKKENVVDCDSRSSGDATLPYLADQEVFDEVSVKRVNSVTSLEDLISLADEDRRYSCEVCGRMYKRKGHLEEHIRRKHSSMAVCMTGGMLNGLENPGKKSVKGSNGVAASGLATLKVKGVIHMEDGERRYPCEYCDKFYKKKSHLDDHRTKNHTHDFRFTCAYCAKGFLRKSHLDAHLVKQCCHEGVPPPGGKRSHFSLMKSESCHARRAESVAAKRALFRAHKFHFKQEPVFHRPAKLPASAKDFKKAEKIGRGRGQVKELVACGSRPVTVGLPEKRSGPEVASSFDRKSLSRQSAGKKSVGCPGCSRKFRLLAVYQDHVAKCCPVPGVVVAAGAKPAVKRGVMTASPQRVKVLQCQFCSRRFVRAKWLSSHEKSHIRCRECNVQFKSQEALLVHERDCGR